MSKRAYAQKQLPILANPIAMSHPPSSLQVIAELYTCVYARVHGSFCHDDGDSVELTRGLEITRVCAPREDITHRVTADSSRMVVYIEAARSRSTFSRSPSGTPALLVDDPR